jgi:hypothetical protein
VVQPRRRLPQRNGVQCDSDREQDRPCGDVELARPSVRSVHPRSHPTLTGARLTSSPRRAPT